MEKKLSILGSTGSIGCQTLDVVRGLGLSVTALAAYQIATWRCLKIRYENGNRNLLRFLI